MGQSLAMFELDFAGKTFSRASAFSRPGPLNLLLANPGIRGNLGSDIQRPGDECLQLFQEEDVCPGPKRQGQWDSLFCFCLESLVLKVGTTEMDHGVVSDSLRHGVLSAGEGSRQCMEPQRDRAHLTDDS